MSKAETINEIKEKINLLRKFNEGTEIQDVVIGLVNSVNQILCIESPYLAKIVLSVAEEIVSNYIQLAKDYKTDYPEWLAELDPEIIKRYN